MEADLNAAFQITVIGMSLVFLAIILLWGLMDILVRVARTRNQGAGASSQEDAERKRHVAAVAVALALALEKGSFEPKEFPLPPTALVSAWQAVMRTSMLGKRGSKK